MMSINPTVLRIFYHILTNKLVTVASILRRNFSTVVSTIIRPYGRERDDNADLYEITFCFRNAFVSINSF